MPCVPHTSAPAMSFKLTMGCNHGHVAFRNRPRAVPAMV